MNKLYAFGDSFTWGSELNDEVKSKGAKHSQYTWTALIAKNLNYEYVCLANPGSGNHSIARTVLDTLDNISINDTVVINWTWIDRWDFYNLQDRNWCTVRPSSNITTVFDRYYYKYFQSELWDKFESLKQIALVHSLLKKNNIKFIATNLDKLIFDTKFHAPKYVTILQDTIKQDIKYFDNLGFYHWAKCKKFKLGKNEHPLEEAHLSAYEYAKSNF